MLKRFAFLLLLLILCRPQASVAEVIDRVVAVVDDEIITLSELEQEGADFFKRVTEQTPVEKLADTMAQARHEVLSQMIDRKITARKAREMNIGVSDSEIESAIKTIIAMNNTTEDNLKREIQAMGLSEEKYRDSIREQILQSKLIGHEVSSKIVITEEKAREYYDKQYMREMDEGGYYLLHLGITWGPPKNRTKEQARAEALQLRERILAGENFKELAHAHSELASAAYGGDIGVVGKDEMAPYMREAVTSLRPGEVSQPVETEAGYQLFQVMAVKEGTVVSLAPFAMLKDYILELLRKQEQERQYKKWVEDLRGKSYVKELL